MVRPAYEVRLTLGAEADLEALHAYLEEHRSIEEADSLLARLLEKIESLERFPERGGVPKELAGLGIREFRQILLPPYRLVYKVSGTPIYVMAIADGRRDMQSLLEARLLAS